MTLRYDPETSLQDHICKFQKVLARHNSITTDKELGMSVSSTMAAAAFLSSLNGDRELTGLIQTLYDLKPFTMSTVIHRVSIEHSQRQQSNDQALFAGDLSTKTQPKFRQNEPRNKGKNRKYPKKPEKGIVNNNELNKSESDKRFESLEKMISRLQATINKQAVHLVNEEKTVQNNSDSDTFMIQEDFIFSTDENKIYLDSGAGKLVVNDLSLLTNVMEINHQINTYGNPVHISHQGRLKFKNLSIHPVHYAQNGPGDTLIATFKREGNLFASKIASFQAFVATDNKDRHTLLGHPSNIYLNQLLKEGKISGKLLSSKKCEICQQTKIQQHPHNNNLPKSPLPFHQLHVDTLEITPITHQGYRYVLVIVNDFSRFNCICLLKKKSEAEGHLKGFVNEVSNKVETVPAFIHTNRGGKFDSNSFQLFLLEKGISLERGPADSPQTNGISERFNQTLLTKTQCLLAQSKIPIELWNKAAKHASLWINHLPHKALGMRTPYDLPEESGKTFLSKLDFKKLISFGIKVMVHKKNTESKLSVQGVSLKALTFEDYSDSMRFYDPDKNIVREQRVPSTPAELLELESTVEERMVTPTVPQREKLRNYEYVPYYDKAPRDISNKISQENIMNEGRRQKKRSERLMLADVVPYKEAIYDSINSEKWKEAISQEFNSLRSHNTGAVVPYPTGNKVIGGMWRLTRKQNEYGEVYRYKERWVVPGNHQDHLLHYFDTWASVGQNKSFKIMLLLVLNCSFIPYQFDVETAFLHGEMDATVYVKQVKGFEKEGKESWVWCLNKSLYGTKQAPRMWQEKLVGILTKCNMMKSNSDDSVFLNQRKTLMLHMHVDNGFIIGKHNQEIITFLNEFGSSLNIKYKKFPTQHLGYKLDWKKNNMLEISQTNLIIKLLHDHNMNDSKGVKTPCNGNLISELDNEGEVISTNNYQKAIGSLNYLAQHTRPDIMFTVNQLSKYLLKPNAKHWTAVKHLLQYLKNTMMMTLHYPKKTSEPNKILAGWTDANYANSKQDRKSITG
ncbi:hypothetical protein O181_093874, partial [Austropuccinia psidii MF-1]|nr:hypothetical protein [Austropuccinia psidii MF-1]